jgi:hypothetical protein
MSEARRAARALVERRTERFESRYGIEESRRRVEAALGTTSPRRVVFAPSWREESGRAVLEATFSPPARTQRFLSVTSVVMTLLVAASAWALLAPGADAALRWLLPLSTAFAILALPFVFVALGSQRLAEESRIRKAIRVALQDEEEALPKRQKWDDEE